MADLIRNSQPAMARAAADVRHEFLLRRDRWEIERGLAFAQVPAAIAAARIEAGALTTKIALVESARVISLQTALTEQLPAGAHVFEQISDAFGCYATAEVRCLTRYI